MQVRLSQITNSLASDQEVDNAISTHNEDSAAHSEQMALKANLESPEFSGTVTMDNLVINGNLQIAGGAITTHSNPSGPPTDPDDPTVPIMFMLETYEITGGSAWIDTLRYDISLGMSKIKITFIADSGGIQISALKSTNLLLLDSPNQWKPLLHLITSA